MAESACQAITVSRRIGAPAGEIFRLLTDPRRHGDLDGSGMLRGTESGPVIRGVGDIFVMKMYFDELGDYQMINHVVEYEPERRIGWEPEAGPGHPNAEPGADRPARWGQRWSYELTPDGPQATRQVTGNRQNGLPLRKLSHSMGSSPVPDGKMRCPSRPNTRPSWLVGRSMSAQLSQPTRMDRTTTTAVSGMNAPGAWRTRPCHPARPSMTGSCQR